MKRILLIQGKFALVDDQDYDFLMQWKWHCYRHRKTFYVTRTVGKKPNQKNLRMHRIISERMGLHGNIDHIDRNGLNNQRNNLRVATVSQNNANQGLRKDNISGYKGVSLYRATNKWRACIIVNRKQIHLGCFINIKDAAKAYNIAALKYFSVFAVLNII